MGRNSSWRAPPKYQIWDATYSTIGAFINGVGIVSKLCGLVLIVEVKSPITGAIIHAYSNFYVWVKGTWL